MSERLKKVGIYDPVTGEVLDGTLRVFGPRRSKNGFDRWIAVNLETDMAMSKPEAIGQALHAMNLTDFRVYHALRAHVEDANVVRVPQTLMAERCKIAPSNFSASVKRLIAMGLVEKLPKLGRSFPLRISPKVAWRGKSDQHIIELHRAA